tara:strand:+ start:518 stop:1012 length:495 start_codon:yes stop_codon:yes gene_type:complete
MVTFNQWVSTIPDGTTMTTLAGKLALNLDDLSIKYGSYGGATNKVYTPVCPVGAIVAWAKSFTNVPALPDAFLECNGQAISDADSPMNGQTLPNLNNSGGSATNRFLRGGTTSGGTGGSETHNHTFTSTFSAAGSGTDVLSNQNTNSTSTLPSYYAVVWVMRIK